MKSIFFSLFLAFLVMANASTIPVAEDITNLATRDEASAESKKVPSLQFNIFFGATYDSASTMCGTASDTLIRIDEKADTSKVSTDCKALYDYVKAMPGEKKSASSKFVSLMYFCPPGDNPPDITQEIGSSDTKFGITGPGTFNGGLSSFSTPLDVFRLPDDKSKDPAVNLKSTTVDYDFITNPSDKKGAKLLRFKAIHCQ